MTTNRAAIILELATDSMFCKRAGVVGPSHPPIDLWCKAIAKLAGSKRGRRILQQFMERMQTT